MFHEMSPQKNAWLDWVSGNLCTFATWNNVNEKMKKTIIFIAAFLLVVGLISCKKEKCQYYNDIMTYYDQSEEAWQLRYEQGSIDTAQLHSQLYKINMERANLQKQYKDCVEK